MIREAYEYQLMWLNFSISISRMKCLDLQDFSIQKNKKLNWYLSHGTCDFI